MYEAAAAIQKPSWNQRCPYVGDLWGRNGVLNQETAEPLALQGDCCLKQLPCPGPRDVNEEAGVLHMRQQPHISAVADPEPPLSGWFVGANWCFIRRRQSPWPSWATAALNNCPAQVPGM